MRDYKPSAFNNYNDNNNFMSPPFLAFLSFEYLFTQMVIVTI